MEKAELRRRAQSHDASLFRRRLLVSDLISSASGVVNTVTSEEAKGEMGPHRPFGTMTVKEAWEVLATRKRLWFPIPISWRDVPELRGTAIFFNKYPNVYDESETPDVKKIWALEPSITGQDIVKCRMNVRRIGPQYVTVYAIYTIFLTPYSLGCLKPSDARKRLMTLGPTTQKQGYQSKRSLQSTRFHRIFLLLSSIPQSEVKDIGRLSLSTTSSFSASWLASTFHLDSTRNRHRRGKRLRSQSPSYASPFQIRDHSIG
jgi:hypothetical protein